MNIFSTKILLAVDGSADSALAARTAVGLSEKTGSELDVVHVAYLVPPSWGSEISDLASRLYEETREEENLQARATQVEEHLGRRPKIRIATVGDPAALLLEAAEEEDAPKKILLAVGSRTWGRGSAWDSGASRPRCSGPLGDRSWCTRALGPESAISFRNLFHEEVHA